MGRVGMTSSTSLRRVHKLVLQPSAGWAPSVHPTLYLVGSQARSEYCPPSPFRAFALLTTIGSLLFSLLNPGAHLSSDMHQDGEGVGGPQFHGNFTVTSGRFAGCISKVD